MFIIVEFVYNNVFLFGCGREVGLVVGKLELYVLGDFVVVGKVFVLCVYGGIFLVLLIGG